MPIVFPRMKSVQQQDGCLKLLYCTYGLSAFINLFNNFIHGSYKKMLPYMNVPNLTE